MTALAWSLIGAASIVLLGIAVGKFLRLADDMERARNELEGVEIDGGMVFDVEPHDLSAMSQAEAEARGLV